MTFHQPLRYIGRLKWDDVHGRSGRVTLPRLNWVLTGLATLETEERFRRVDRAMDWRSSVVDILREFESFALDRGGQLSDDKCVEENDV